MDITKIHRALDQWVEHEYFSRSTANIHFEYICKLFSRYDHPYGVSKSLLDAAMALSYQMDEENHNAFIERLKSIIEAADYADRKITMITETEKINT